MRIVRWGAAAVAAAATCVPAVAEAATPSSSTAVPTSGTTARQTAASSTATTPAPAGTAEAYAIKIGSIAAVSHTRASASGSGSSATADPLELGGNPPSPHFGGTQNGDGTSTGSLLDTGTTPLGRLAVTPWSASVSGGSSGSSASALSDVLLLDLGTQGTQQSASLRVLQSQSNATWTPQQSTGSSSSDGAILDVGGPNGLLVDVLHSQSSSTGAGSSYLLSINGNQIGSSSQANGQCALTVPSLLSLECLTASGGVGSNAAGGTTLTSTGEVLTATLGPAGSPLTADLVRSTSTSAKAPAASPAVTPSVSAASHVASVPAAAPAAAPAASAAAVHSAPSTLPFTGANVGLLIAAGLSLAGAGMGLVAAARRRPVMARVAQH
jgi:hypothetical protein